MLILAKLTIGWEQIIDITNDDDPKYYDVNTGKKTLSSGTVHETKEGVEFLLLNTTFLLYFYFIF